MKKKFICVMLAGLIFSLSSFSFSTPLAVKADVQVQSEEVTNDNAKYNTEFNAVSKDIKDMAGLLVNQGGRQKEASVQYAIMNGDSLILSDNAGKLDLNDDEKVINKDTTYGLGSVSKMYVTAAVMQLVDEKKIDLDLPLVNYIKDFKMADDRYVKITPRMLINHSSGLRGSSSRNVFLINDSDSFVHDNFLERLSSEKLKAEPGEFSVYCNDGFELAEILVERVSGKSFTNYINENFSKKLNLSKTRTPEQLTGETGFAKTYTYKSEGDPFTNYMAVGAGGISSNAEEVCKFARAITRKDGQGLLSARSVDLMSERESVKGVWPGEAEGSFMDFGLGWDSVDLFPFNQYGIKAYGKGGDLTGYHAYMLVLPEYNLSMAVVSAGGSSVRNYSFAASSLLKVLKSKGIINEIKEDVKWQEERSKYCPDDYFNSFATGLYNFGDSLDKVTVENGVLTITDLFHGSKITAHHTYSNYFITDDNSTVYNFVQETNGKTYLKEKQYIPNEGLSQVLLTQYVGQKVDAEADIEGWEKHMVDFFLPLNEKYSALAYSVVLPIANFGIRSNGYILGNKIVSADEAVAEADIPGLNGRDWLDYKFYKENNIDYCNVGDIKYKAGSQTLNFNDDIKEVTIGDEGETEWYMVPAGFKEASISVEHGDNASFFIYDMAKGYVCANDSYLSKVKEGTLHAGDIIGFAGDKGEKFKITLSR